MKLLSNATRKVQPSCGKPAFLSLNPKANNSNGWTANEKVGRKRKQPATCSETTQETEQTEAEAKQTKATQEVHGVKREILNQTSQAKRTEERILNNLKVF